MSLSFAQLRLFQCPSETIPWDSPVMILGFKVLVVALLINSEEDIIVSSMLLNMTAEQLRDATQVDIERSTRKIEDVKYEMTTVTIGFPSAVYKKQSYTFMTNPAQQKGKTLLIAKSSGKLDILLMHWFMSEYGLQINPLRFDSQFLIECLNSLVDNLPDKTKLGNVDLSFTNSSQNKMLSTISVELPNKDLVSFDQVKTTTLFQEVMTYLQDQTTIKFDKLKISKFRCQFMVMGSDGRVRFLRGMPMLGSTEVINFTAWDFIHRIHTSL